MDSEPVMFLGGSAGPSFRTRVVTIAPGDRLPYVDSDWRDALVVVEVGEVELECGEGSRLRVAGGDVLWLVGLGLRAVRNPGAGPAVLVAVSRQQRGERDPA